MDETEGARIQCAASARLLQTLIQSLPEFVPVACADSKICEIFRKVPEPVPTADPEERWATFNCRMDLLFGNDVRNQDGKLCNITRGLFGMDLVVEYALDAVKAGYLLRDETLPRLTSMNTHPCQPPPNNLLLPVVRAMRMVSSAKCALSMLRPFQTHLAIPRRIWRMKSLAISNLGEGSRQMNMTRLYGGRYAISCQSLPLLTLCGIPVATCWFISYYCMNGPQLPCYSSDQCVCWAHFFKISSYLLRSLWLFEGRNGAEGPLVEGLDQKWVIGCQWAGKAWKKIRLCWARDSKLNCMFNCIYMVNILLYTVYVYLRCREYTYTVRLEPYF